MTIRIKLLLILLVSVMGFGYIFKENRKIGSCWTELEKNKTEIHVYCSNEKAFQDIGKLYQKKEK